MNKTCSRCQKTVYPIEELKCLDKVWHKGCFKCQECGMTLNMKTYKGYGKLPYCEAHVPKAKHTTMAETPELRRIAENTKLQSNVIYHADFEKSKGKFTQVADDPETLRIKQNTQIISNVAYHGDLAKKAAMEKQRTLNENGELIELPTPDNYDIQIESYDPEIRPPSASQTSASLTSSYVAKQPQYPLPSDYANSNQVYRSHPKNEQTQPKYDQQQPKYEQQQPKYEQKQTKYDQQQPKYEQHPQYEQPKFEQQQPRYEPSQPKYDLQQPKYNQYEQQQKYEQQPKHEQQPRYDNQQQRYDNQQQRYDNQQQRYEQQQPRYEQQQPRYEQQQPRYEQQQPRYQPPYQAEPQHNYQPNAAHAQRPHDDYARQSRDMIQREQYGGNSQSYQQQQQRIGKIEDYDPVTDGPRQQVFTTRPSATLIYNSSERNNGRGAHTTSQPQRRPIGSVNNMDPLSAERQLHAEPPKLAPPSAKVYIAIYDYEATDTDEVSFLEGDLISNVTSIDEGWMTGQVLRTGRTGMLPANYVELAPM